MRLRTTIILILVLVGVAFVAALDLVPRSEAQKFQEEKAALEKEWGTGVKMAWSQPDKELRTLVDELVKRGDVVSAILDSNTAWAETNWDTKTLNAYGANAIWVYRRDGTLFYAHANTESGGLVKLRLGEGEVEKAFSGKTAHFYLSLPPTTKGLRVVDVVGQVVWPVWDGQGKEPAEGYLFAGRVWDEEKARLVFSPEGNDAKIRPPHEPPALASEQSAMRYVQPLLDWRGREVADLVVTHTDPRIDDLDRRSHRDFRNLLFAALGLIAAVFLLLDQVIMRPLRRVIRALHNEDLDLLRPIQKENSEFGELARLIQAFFDQQTSLVREMLERMAAEKKLHESEEMLRHSQKMEAVGRLAGGVAHDFNNLLTAIIGYADILMRRDDGNARARQAAQLIHQAAQQAAGLTRQLLAFSRKQLLQPKVIDLNTVITNLQRLLQRIIGEHIRIQIVIGEASACIKADPGQIEQVIVNLGVNARDAMPRGGQLTMRTGAVHVDGTAPLEDLSPGEYVIIEVSDTGEGMDAETKARIFEPFFTTKGPGKGTGLGLATVFGIVKQSHGGIMVESERGKGATFRIYLPRTTEPLEPMAAAVLPSSDRTQGETILVVEDEEIVRDLVHSILTDQGYRVLVADRGSEAVRLARAEPNGIDLLVSDIVMPESNGAVVAREVHAICPRARVLFVSGYSEADMADQGMDALAFQVLQKPFTPDAFLKKIRDLLDGVNDGVTAATV